jgi:hypothetical protein
MANTEGNQGTIRRRARVTFDEMEDIIKMQKVSLDIQHKAISELIEMINTKSKSIPEILEFSQLTEKILGENVMASELLEALRKVTKCLKVNIENLIDEVTDLRKEVKDLRNAVENLKQQLEISHKRLARLNLRHILRQPESLIYKKYFPDTDLSRRTYKLSELKDRLRKKNPGKLNDLTEFLKEINFDENETPVVIENIIHGYDLNSAAHPEESVITTITDMEQFELNLEMCELTSNDMDNCRKIAEAYFKLRGIE